jgi:hypothetical protein
MFSINPFAGLSGFIPAGVMQGYVVLMVVLVAAGTLYDVVHKGSAKYFFANWRKSREKGTRQVEGGELASLAVKTAVVDVLASGEFCNQRRRVAHLLTMYGFLLHFIRVDVAAEGNSPFRLMRADLFILSLLASVTLGLAWAWLQAKGSDLALLALGLYFLATTVLFGGVPWSKFAHMFFKPAAALEKRVSEANGTCENLPTISREDPGQRDRHSMELLKDAPMDMGLGIKREAPRHY